MDLPFGIDPTTLGSVGMGAQGAGAILSFIGAFSAASGQQSMARGRAEIARINAATAENTARSVLMSGQREEQRSRLATANLKSTQTAHFAANGVDLGEGSTARTLASTDILGEIDANTIAANAVRSAWGYKTQAVNYQNDARMSEAQADSISPGLSAAGSLLTSASQVAGSWYAMSNATGAPISGHSAYWKS